MTATQTTETLVTTTAEAPARKVREVKVHQAGPRGFTFGKTWNKSVIEGKGLALHASNLPKLQAQAKAVGVEDVENMTQSALAEAVAAKLALAEIVAGAEQEQQATAEVTETAVAEVTETTAE